MRQLPVCTFLLLASVVSGGDLRVQSFTELTSDGGRVAWGANNVIAFDRANSAGYYDVWTMNPDASNQTCITCNWQPPGLSAAGYNKGNPDWHPSGNWIVFQAQRSDTTYGPVGAASSRPGVGVDNVIWIADSAGVNYYQVPASAAYTAHNGGVLHPHFSHDGQHLIWAQATSIAAPGQGGGTWEIQYASFQVVNGQPQVTLLQSLTPGACPGLYETHGFSLDDTTIFFSGNPDCQPYYGTDIHSYNLNTGQYVNLTNSPDQWDEHSRPHPTMEKLIWVSSVGRPSPAGPGPLQLEYWTMNYDGTDKKKMTWFEDTRGPYFIQGSPTPGDNDWSPDGTQSVVYLENTSGESGSSQLGASGSIWLVTFEPSSTTTSSADYGNYPQPQDGIITSFGADLANATTLASTFPLPMSLAGTTVSVADAAGIARQAQVFSVSPTQVNFALPSGTAPGPSVITTTSGDGTVTRDTFDVEVAAPGIFTATSTGSGAAAAYVQTSSGVVEPTFDCSSGTCIAAPVDAITGGSPNTLVLFVTGVRHSSSVTVNINGVDYQPAYAGAQGQDVDLDQINVTLPASLAGAGLVNIYVTAQNAVNAGTVSNIVQVDFR